MFDGTAALTAQLPTAPVSDVTAIDSGSQLYAIAFNFSEADATCGPGVWTITQITLAAVRSSQASTSFIFQLYTADPVTGLPIAAVALTTGASVAIPVTPGYVTTSFALSFDAGFYGLSYALVISAQRAVNLVSVNNGQVNSQPVSARGAAFASYSSANYGSSWTVQSTYRGAVLRAIKGSCGATPTQTSSLTPSQTNTPSLSVTRTVSGRRP